MEKLEDAFPEQTTYYFEQLLKGVYESGPEKAAHARPCAREAEGPIDAVIE
jgi:hypothetical protein